MTRPHVWVAFSPLLRMRRSTTKSRRGVAGHRGHLQGLDRLTRYANSRNVSQLLYYSSSSPAATQHSGDDRTQPSGQVTSRRAAPHLPSRYRHLVPSDLEKRSVEKFLLEESLEQSINKLADRLGVTRPTMSFDLASRFREMWVAGQATVDDVEEAELRDDVRRLDYARMFAKELAFKASQEAQQAAEAAAKASSRAGGDCIAEDIRSLLQTEAKAAGIAAATEDYANLKQEAWELAVHARKMSTERRLRRSVVTIKGAYSGSVHLRWRVQPLCSICSDWMHDARSCHYLKAIVTKDFTSRPEVDTLFTRKLQFEPDFHTALL